MVVCVKVTKDAMKNYTLLRFRALTLRPNKIESIEPWWKFCEVPRRNALTFREKFLHIFLFSRPLFRSLFVFENQKSKETNNRLLVPETKWSIKIAAWWRLFFDLFPFPEQQVIITAKGVEFHMVNYWEHKGLYLRDCDKQGILYNVLFPFPGELQRRHGSPQTYYL